MYEMNTTATLDWQMMSSPSSQEIITTLNPQPLNSFSDNTPTATTTVKHQHHQNPRKKRMKVKLVKLDRNNNLLPKISKPKYAKKPDPNAPEVTEPCSECGRKFWSWKALFGHMRCHPERTWRGINPPPNFRRAPQTSPGYSVDSTMTDEDHEVANCLLKLANTCATVSQSESDNSVRDMQAVTTTTTTADCLRFECSSCKKVFGSHQALGGHRASHKNVKGCFAITRINDVDGGYIDNEGAVREKDHGEDGDLEKMMMVLGGHKCSICLRVFSSGQALGGHKRCHWEKGETSSLTTLALAGFQHYGFMDGGCGLDLNLPAPLEEDDSSYSADLSLDLRCEKGNCPPPKREVDCKHDIITGSDFQRMTEIIA